MRLIKLKLLVVAVLLVVAAVFPACSFLDDPEPETPATALADQLRTGYLMEQDLATQQRVFWQYYNYDVLADDVDGDYFIMHSHELRFLPEFALGDEPDWEQTSRYLCDFAPHTTNADGALRWSFDDFVAAGATLLPCANIEREDSGWLNYIADEDCYDAVGWDANGAVYYLLTEPLTCEDGVYTAHFAGYAVGEMWFEDDEDYGKNYNDRTLYELWEHGGEDLSYFIDNILPGELAAENLTRCEDVVVIFSLSGNETLPLSYISCEREETLSN